MGALITETDIRWKNAEATLAAYVSDIKKLENKTVAITGATGLIGSQLARVFICANDELNLNIKLLLPLRDAAKAHKLFGATAKFIPWKLGDSLELRESCDYFVHTACTTSSKDFAEKPVETALDIIDGARACLKAAHSAGCSAFVYLSTMEVFGEPTAKPAKEEDLGFLDPMSPRNSYPLAKLACENLMASFAAEYGMRTAVLRLTLTFGAGVNTEDGRVFAEFARSARDGKNITLLSDGSKRNCYLAVDDAASAIIVALASEDAVGVYNTANPNTYFSIHEMAEMVLSEFGAPESKVVFGSDPARSKTFRKGDDIQLDISRLKALDWMPRKSLKDMYADVLAGWAK